MLGAGTVINPIVKIVTTVAILAAVYFFIIKPTLDTTETISSGINESVSQSLGSSNGQVERALRRAERLAAQTDAQIDVPNGAGSVTEAQKLLKCIQRAAGDVEAMQRCSQ